MSQLVFTVSLVAFALVACAPWIAEAWRAGR